MENHKKMTDTFTDKTKALWNSIPEEEKELLLRNVWCTNCINTTTITNYDGKVEGGFNFNGHLCNLWR